jgi:hypothetical protein
VTTMMAPAISASTRDLSIMVVIVNQTRRKVDRRPGYARRP